MAHHKSALKSIRQCVKVTAQRKAQMSRLRTFVRRAREALAGGDKAAAVEAVRMAESVLARSAQKKLLHRKTASRITSRMHARLLKVSAAS